MREKSVFIYLGVLLLSGAINGTTVQRRLNVNVKENEFHESENARDMTTRQTTEDLTEAKLREAESQLNVTAFYQKGNLNCHCGIGKGSNRIFPTQLIVGGSVSNIADIPWTVLVYRLEKQFGGSTLRIPHCGGTLINNYYVVTAAHCVDRMASKVIEVVLNEQNKTSSGQLKRQVFQVSKIIQHKKYSRRTVDNDIALLQLAKAVDLEGDSPVAPACIPKINDNFDGKFASAAGWGALQEGGGQSKTLRNVTVPVLTNEKCMSKDYKGKITENMICAGDFETGGVDACKGDSGGPLITEVDNRQLLIGVTSWGEGCGLPNKPGVYARVTRYLEWILSHTADAEWCG